MLSVFCFLFFDFLNDFSHFHFFKFGVSALAFSSFLKTDQRWQRAAHSFTFTFFPQLFSEFSRLFSTRTSGRRFRWLCVCFNFRFYFMCVYFFAFRLAQIYFYLKKHFQFTKNPISAFLKICSKFLLVFIRCVFFFHDAKR